MKNRLALMAALACVGCALAMACSGPDGQEADGFETQVQGSTSCGSSSESLQPLQYTPAAGEAQAAQRLSEAFRMLQEGRITLAQFNEYLNDLMRAPQGQHARNVQAQVIIGRLITTLNTVVELCEDYSPPRLTQEQVVRMLREANNDMTAVTNAGEVNETLFAYYVCLIGRIARAGSFCASPPDGGDGDGGAQCGAFGQQCCGGGEDAGSSCNDSAVSSCSSNLCTVCGGAGQPCCGSSTCSGSLFCFSGSCMEPSYCSGSISCDSDGGVTDAGLPPLDAGTPPADAGTPPADAGTPPPWDAGTPPPWDAGMPPSWDAGMPVPADAGGA